MKPDTKTYRNQYIDQLGPKFKRVYEYQIHAVDEMLKTGKPVEVQFRDWRALDRFRRKVYELGNIIGMRLSTRKLDPYTLEVTIPTEPVGVDDEITIGGRPVTKIQPISGIGLGGEVELTPEQEAKVAEAMKKLADMGQKEIDTEDFLEKVFGKGSQDDNEGDKP